MKKTYVKVKFNNKFIDQKFDTIDEAVAYAEQHHEADEDDVLDIYVYSDDGSYEHQESSRNPHSGDFIYYAWGIFGENFFDDSQRVSDSEILAECINSEEEARELAETIRDKFDKFDRVTIASYSQTTSENVGDLGEKIVIYGKDIEKE